MIVENAMQISTNRIAAAERQEDVQDCESSREEVFWPGIGLFEVHHFSSRSVGEVRSQF